MPKPSFTVPNMSTSDAAKVIDLLQQRLVSLIDLDLTLKHVHWNVVGPTFIGVHQMLDPQVAAVRLMVDATAERIATLGGSPNGLPGNLVGSRSWEDYPLGRSDVMTHLGELDAVYDGVVGDHRKAIEEVEDLDKVSQDMLIEQSAQLEQFHWFVRAHLEAPDGELMAAGARRTAPSGTRRSSAAKPAPRRRARQSARG
jgi:starvation-inducible DNA-binding protein